MFEAYATPTTKSYHPAAAWKRSSQVRIASAETLPELKEKLASFYGRSWKHKKPMYCDMKDGRTVRTGWVVGMRIHEGPGEKYLQQDWVSIRECNEVMW